MSNELDLSAFDEDEKPTSAEAAPVLDLSAFDEQKSEPEKKTSTFADGASSIATGAAIGGAVGKLGQVGANVFDKFALDRIGKLDRSQQDFITANPEVYKKASSWENLLNDFKSLAEDSNKTTVGATKHYGNYIRKGAQDLKETGIHSAKIARESLPGTPSIRTEEFYKVLANQAQDPVYSIPLPESAQNEFIAQSLDDNKPRRDIEKSKILDIDNNISQLNEQLKNPPVDERSLINQEHKNTQFQNKISQLDDRLAPNRDDQIVGAKDDLKFKTEARKLQRIEERKAELEIKAQEKPSASKALENIQKRKEDFIYNQTNTKEAMDVTRGAKVSKELDAAEKRKAQLTLQKIEEDFRAAKLKEAAQKIKEEKIAQKLSELEADKKASLERIEKITLESKESGNKSYFKTLNTPEEIRAAANGALDNKKMGKIYASNLESIVDRVRGGVEIPPQTMDQIIQEIRDGVNYGEKGSPAPELDKKVAREVRFGLMGPETHPIYNKNMTIAHETMKAQEALEEAAQVKYNEAGQAILPKTSEDKLSKVLAQPDVYQDEFKQLNAALDQTGAHTQTPLPLAQERLAQSARLDNDFNSFGVKVDDYGNVDISDSGKAKLQELVSNPNPANAEKIQRLQSLLEEARTISSNQSGPDGKTMLNNMTASGIKEVVKGADISNMNMQRVISSGAKGLAGATVGGLTGGPAGGALGAVAGAGFDIYGTKLQELMARYKSTGFYKNVASPVIENGGKIGAALGSTLGLTGVAMADDTEQAAGDFASDTALDVAAMGAGKLASAVGPAAVAGPFGVAANIGAQALSPSSSGSVLEDKMMMKDSEAFQKYRNSAARKDIFPMATKPKAFNEDFKSFVEQDQNQVQELAQFFKNESSTQAFVAPLEKAAQGDDRTRSAVLFGLYQQPAFRLALKKKN